MKLLPKAPRCQSSTGGGTGKASDDRIPGSGLKEAAGLLVPLFSLREGTRAAVVVVEEGFLVCCGAVPVGADDTESISFHQWTVI